LKHIGVLLKDKVALVTGSAKRLGREIVLALAEAGYVTVINYLSSKSEAKQLEKEIIDSGKLAITIKADVSKSMDVRSMFNSIIKKFGHIDLLINNAGVFEKIPFNELDEKAWNKTIDTNLKSSFLCSLEASKYMYKDGGGKIINISSLGGFRPFKNYLPYSVSKAGVIMLTKCLAKELSPDIAVNSIAPGMIEFPDERKKIRKILKSEKIPMRKYGIPKDITDLILFLADSANYITGQTFIVDGGKILT
jgi:NAD(P)-dependent dehydrogenase (short-subunit alcohol dehydrogenase family)